MLLAFVAGYGDTKDELDLCLVADKVDALSKPVRVSCLFPNPAGVIRIGPEEAVLVNQDQIDGSLVVSAMMPAAIYLTPNLPQTPGFKVKRIKLQITGGEYQVSYDRDKGSWEPWVANRERT